MQRRIAVTLFCGILAGFLPLLPRAGLLFCIWSAFLPLLFLGLSEGARCAIQGGSIAVAVTTLLGTAMSAIDMAIFAMLPISLFLSRILLYQSDETGRRVWYPPLKALSELTLLTVVVFLGFSMLVTRGHNASLSDMVKSSFTMDMTAFEPSTANLLHSIVNDWGFLVFASVIWGWILTLWLLAVIANRILVARAQALRPDIALAPGGLPAWLSLLLLLFIALSLTRNAADAFAGKTAVLVLLLPYFLSGMAIIHGKSYKWQARRFWLTIMYILLIFQFWTTVLVAGMGLYHHLAEMLDKRARIG